MEGDAGTSQLNLTDADGTSDEVVTEAPADPAPETPVESSGQPSRLSRGWLIGIAAVLLVVGVAVATGGYLALRAHDDSQALARADIAALRAAKDCVAATQAPDTAAIAAAQQKIVECSTGDFAAQATLYSGVLVDAYQAANVQVQVSDMRAAVERHNDDGSINVLVAVRVKVSNSQAQNQEQGYRLRVQMAPDNGQYKIARLDQVSS
jgi:Mce-associated membrane protein